MSARPLHELQAWLQGAILSAARAASPLVDDGQTSAVLTATSRQSAAERLTVYQRAYAARLLEVLRQEFPVLLHVLGQPAFEGLAAAYLAEHPSRSYTLAELGAAFPRFLAQGPRGTDEASASPQAWVSLLADVALWERTTCEIYSGPGLEGGTPFDSAGLAGLSLEDWLETRLQFAPCFRLVEFRCAAVEFCLGVRRGEQPPLPASQVCYAAATRVAYRVRWRVLVPAEYEMLLRLAAGASVGEALVALGPSATTEEDVAPAEALYAWFCAWGREQYFQALTRV